MHSLECYSGFHAVAFQPTCVVMGFFIPSFLAVLVFFFAGRKSGSMYSRGNERTDVNLDMHWTAKKTFSGKRINTRLLG